MRNIISCHIISYYLILPLKYDRYHKYHIIKGSSLDFTPLGQVALLHVNDPGLHTIHRLRGETRHRAGRHGAGQVEAHVIGVAHGQGAA